jgi:transposase
MDATQLTAATPLPDNVPELQALVRTLLAEIAQLREKLDAALRHRFGRRSERRPQPPTARAEDKPPKKVTPHGRGALPAELERRDAVHDLTDADKRCPCCGQVRLCIGEQVAEQLDMEPVHFFVLRTIKKSYACPQCDPAAVPAEQRVQTAGPAQVGPIAKGLCGPGLLAHVLTAKFADHIPLHRLAGQLSRSRVGIARSTLGGWVAAAAELLEPLYQFMHQRILLSRVIHSDDTGVKLRVPGQGRTHPAHLWAYLGDADYPYVVFDFTKTYTADGPEQFLQGYKGYLQADALAQYECMYGPDKILHCCCWAHARRKFVAAADAGEALARDAVAWVGQLYAIERDLPPLLPPSDDPAARDKRLQREEQRRRQRREHAGPIMTALKTWLDEHRPQALPKSALGQAIGYALNNWEALQRYLEQGYLAIDNNLSERTLRAIAVGRNNWGVIGSATAGDTAAVLFSMVGTCKHLGIDPFAYLREALPALFALGDKPPAEVLLPWLPDRWQWNRGAAAPQVPPTEPPP